MLCYFPASRSFFQLPPVEQTDATNNLAGFGTLAASVIPPLCSPWTRLRRALSSIWISHCCSFLLACIGFRSHHHLLVQCFHFVVFAPVAFIATTRFSISTISAIYTPRSPISSRLSTWKGGVMVSYQFDWFAEDITHIVDPCIVQVFLVWYMVVCALWVFTVS